MKHYFLGLAGNYTRKRRLKHICSIGRKRDCLELEEFLEKKYGGEAVLCKNGRSALALALKSYFDRGDGILVNGFTCYAVYEAIKSAGLIPIFVDIEKSDLNFSVNTLKKALTNSVSTGTSRPATPKGIIVQNTLGNPVDINEIEKFAKKYGLLIIEDLAHCTGVKYSDGREAGTIGVATALSFGKDKSIDTISGGAVILRHPCKNKIEAPTKLPKLSDTLRARFYPLFGAMTRGLTRVRLGGIFMRVLLKLRFVEKSADNKLDLERRIAKFQAKLGLEQLKNLKKSGEPPIREFYLINNRDEVLKKLKKNGYYLDGFWYEKPVSPERYYKKVHFPEKDCPTSVEVAEKIVNLPTFYSKEELAPARKIIKEYLDDGK